MIQFKYSWNRNNLNDRSTSSYAIWKIFVKLKVLQKRLTLNVNFYYLVFVWEYTWYLFLAKSCKLIREKAVKFQVKIFLCKVQDKSSVVFPLLNICPNVRDWNVHIVIFQGFRQFSMVPVFDWWKYIIEEKSFIIWWNIK